jgi:hypothetical protein
MAQQRSGGEGEPGQGAHRGPGRGRAAAAAVAIAAIRASIVPVVVSISPCVPSTVRATSRVALALGINAGVLFPPTIWQASVSRPSSFVGAPVAVRVEHAGHRRCPRMNTFVAVVAVAVDLGESVPVVVTQAGVLVDCPIAIVVEAVGHLAQTWRDQGVAVVAVSFCRGEAIPVVVRVGGGCSRHLSDLGPLHG